jgi:multicomponent Na+:H+ antiporter subunit D
MGEPIAWVVVLPLLAAGATFVAGRRVGPPLALGFLAAIEAATVLLVAQVARDGPITYALGGWAAPLGVALRADGVSVFLLAVSGAVGGVLLLHAMWALRGGRARGVDAGTWLPLWFFLWLGVSGVVLAADLFNAYVALELLGLSAVALVALAGGGAITAALRYLFANLIGSFLYLLGVALVYAAHGVVDMATLAAIADPGALTLVALAAMIAGLALKTALFPLHFWLPAAHAGALTPVSALLSGIVVKASFYLGWRLWTEVFAGLPGLALAEPIAVLGAAGVVWGSVQAIRQRRLKMLVAYSTVAQVGTLFLVVPLVLRPEVEAAATGGAFLLVASHACGKAAMFLAAGALLQVTAGDPLAHAPGLARRAPLTVFTFGLAGITLVGLPPTGGFLAKWLLLSAAIAAGHVLVAATLIIGTALAAAYVFPFLARALRQLPAGGPPVERAPWWHDLPAFTLALAGALLGLVARAPLALVEVGRSASAGGAP